MDRLTKIIGLVTSGALLLAGAYEGATVTHDTLQDIERLQGDVMQVEMRLDSKIVGDQAAQIQQRQWSLEDRYKGKIEEAPATAREEYRKLQRDREALERTLSSIEQRARTRGQDPRDARTAEPK